MIVWNAEHGYKVQAIPLLVPWVMCCAYSPSGQLVASGGLDNRCTIYNLAQRKSPVQVPISHTLMRQSDYISACRFVSDRELLTASGDGSIMLWDVQNEQPITSYNGGRGDILCMNISQANPNMFVSSGTSGIVHVWDRRASALAAAFTGHRADVTAVDFFPDGCAVVSASEDTTCRLFDLRADRQLMSFEQGASASMATSIALSQSGRLLFAGYDSQKIFVWDTLRGERISTLNGHNARVASLRTSPQGTQVVSGGWDGRTIIWGI